VLDRTRYGVPSRARRAAIAGLPVLSQTRRTREHLEGLLDDGDPHIRLSAVRALETLGDTRTRGPLGRRLSREQDGRVTRAINEALRRLGDDGAAEKRRVNDEMEELRREVEGLKRRLGKLESARPKSKSERSRQ
jgi:aminopeptidase N